MKIFADEFVNALKRSLICRLFGHKPSEWIEEWWALATKLATR
jgi:hypothetical protein